MGGEEKGGFEVQNVLMREAEEEALWLGRVSECVCVCTCMRVSDRGAQYRQFIPTGNTAAALLGQCAIVSFIIITACLSSCALSPHPSHIFLHLRWNPFTCRLPAAGNNVAFSLTKFQLCLRKARWMPLLWSFAVQAKAT